MNSKDNVHMRRISLLLDKRLLAQAMQALGVKTYSEAVNLALAEVLRVKRVLELRHAFGQNLWVGRLSGMREDRSFLAPVRTDAAGASGGSRQGAR